LSLESWFLASGFTILLLRIEGFLNMIAGSYVMDGNGAQLCFGYDDEAQSREPDII
jgi:hypothetical protein